MSARDGDVARAFYSLGLICGMLIGVAIVEIVR